MEVEHESVSVKWWNHCNALCRAVKEMYRKGMFVDVRLVCEGKEHWAHKFVLSACSEFFEEHIANIPHEGTFALPPQVQEKEFLALLDFMYLGVVEVLREDLPELVTAAEKLMIRGLAVPYDDEDLDQGEEGSPHKETDIVEEIHNSVHKRKHNEVSDKDDELMEVKVEEVDSFLDETKAASSLDSRMSREVSIMQRIADQNCQVTSSNVEVNSLLKVVMGGNPKRTRKKTTKGAEMELKPEVTEKCHSFVCPQCAKTFQWRSNLTKHLRTHTGEKPYSCTLCAYKTSYSEALKRHIRTHNGEKANRYTSKAKSDPQNVSQENDSPEGKLVINEPYMAPSPPQQYNIQESNIEIKEEDIPELEDTHGMNAYGQHHY